MLQKLYNYYVCFVLRISFCHLRTSLDHMDKHLQSCKTRLDKVILFLTSSKAASMICKFTGRELQSLRLHSSVTVLYDVMEAFVANTDALLLTVKDFRSVEHVI